MRLVIVDDEPLARSALVDLCERDEDLRVVGEADCGAAAIAAVERLQPDLLLLDIELPDMTGFDVLLASRAQPTPRAIMITAHAHHAVRAFAAGALDYLLKPVSSARFLTALDRAREPAATQQGSRVPRAPAPSTTAAPASRMLIGEREHRLYPLDPDKIEYIESDGNYVTIRTATAEYISRDSIKRLAPLLGERGFLRIERSLLVNVHAIAYAEPAGRGSFAFTLASGSRLHSSATYRHEILEALPLVRVPGGRSSA